MLPKGLPYRPCGMASRLEILAYGHALLATSGNYFGGQSFDIWILDAEAMPVFQYSKLFCGFSALRTQRSLPIRSPVDRGAIRNEPQPPPFDIYSYEPAEAWSRVFHSDSSTPPSRSARVTLREMTAGILPMMPTRKILPPINTSTSASAYLR